MTEMPAVFCRDCKWIERHAILSWNNRYCKHPDSKREPVGGRLEFCVQRRSAYGTDLCGPLGKQWEARRKDKAKC